MKADRIRVTAATSTKRARKTSIVASVAVAFELG
jgi:hypothetical protein